MFFNLFNRAPDFSKNRIRPVALLVIDGWGVAPPGESNAISLAKVPTMQRLQENYASGQLVAAGESVGLPANEEGNSEVGHLTIGVGRMILQSLPRINEAIKTGEFGQNRSFILAATHVRRHNSNMHLMGLIGSGAVHAATEHLCALLDFCKKHEVPRVFLHVFTDGRDAPPKQAAETIAQLEEHLHGIRLGRIATVGGRYYAMDRDRRWERTQKAYEAIVAGQGPQAATAADAVQAAYATEITDEFIEPTVIVENGRPVATLNDNDAVVFFNFRIDRPRQLVAALTMEQFETMDKEKLNKTVSTHEVQQSHATPKPSDTFRRSRVARNVFFVTMTEYAKALPVSAIAFPPQPISDSLPEVVSQHNMCQLHLAESEKERMVTFYFNGLRDEAFVGEDRVIIPSPNVDTYDTKPEMRVHDLVDACIKALGKDRYQFFVLNFANPDMVGHTGRKDAAIKAIEHVDDAIEKLANAVLSAHGTLVVTADHGNVEAMMIYERRSYYFTTQQGSVNTAHSGNPVPIVIVAADLYGNKTPLAGTLADVAPTVLTRMGLPVPTAMKGKNLL